MQLTVHEENPPYHTTPNNPTTPTSIFTETCLRDPLSESTYESKFVHIETPTPSTKRPSSQSNDKKISLIKKGSLEKRTHSSDELKRKIKPLKFKFNKEPLMKQKSSEVSTNANNVSYTSTRPSICSIKQYKNKINSIKKATDQEEINRNKQKLDGVDSYGKKKTTQTQNTGYSMSDQKDNSKNNNKEELLYTFANSLVINNGSQAEYINPSSYFASLKNSDFKEHNSPLDSKHKISSKNSLECSHFVDTQCNSNRFKGEDKERQSSSSSKISKISSGLTLNMARKVETLETMKTENDQACYSFIEDEEDSKEFRLKLGLPTNYIKIEEK